VPQTGEEAETALADMKCKLYRFDPESSEWKERGVGQVRTNPALTLTLTPNPNPDPSPSLSPDRNLYLTRHPALRCSAPSGWHIFATYCCSRAMTKSGHTAHDGTVGAKLPP
jgi:hypothetical protein